MAAPGVLPLAFLLSKYSRGAAGGGGAPSGLASITAGAV
jgi:hypothetical protein